MEKTAVDRRNFMKSVVAGAATLAAPATLAPAQIPVAQQAAPQPSANAEVLTEGRSGSDFMVDVIKSLGIEYVCVVAASSFRGLHESVINYGENKSPELLTCLHEESAVAMGHGYAKIEGKPLGVFVLGTVGLQHASMAVYNAYCDRVPVFIIGSNVTSAEMRDAGYGDWRHSALDPAVIVRDFTKWDDIPASLTDFAESASRAYSLAMTPPMGTVMLTVNSELQENPIPEGENPVIPKLALPSPPQGDSGAVAEAARLLVLAENPVIIADRAARTQAGVDHLIELAEALQAPVIDLGGRMNFPSEHPLNQSERRGALVGSADVILALEPRDLWSDLNSYHDQIHRSSHPITKSGAKLITISTKDIYIKSNYQEFSRYVGADLAMAADSEATLPSLVEQVKLLTTADRKRTFEDRGAKFAAAHGQARQRALTAATYGWDASPITNARLSAEVWAQVRSEDWSLVSRRPEGLWSFDKHYQHIGETGGGGVGYGAPAAVGAALANRKYGRLTVNLQTDGDLLFAPGVLWTAAHHRIPLLNVMVNNRAYHTELMHIQRMACRRNRGIDRFKIGTTFEDPNIDFAKIAQGMGMYGEGPITNPSDLAPALKRAIAVVKRGEPALVDVVIQD